jgi:hypothetical protein
MIVKPKAIREKMSPIRIPEMTASRRYSIEIPYVTPHGSVSWRAPRDRFF